MTDVLHIPGQLDAPVACDLSTAEDTAEERLADYQRQFERSLLRRERREDGVVFAFRAEGGTREALHDLARREAACCPFLDYRIETLVVQITSSPSALSPRERVARASRNTSMPAYALADHTGSDIDGFLGRLADAGVEVVAVDDGFEVRSAGCEPELPFA
jgi:hypothetical protein